jgi:hypothetical protein
MHKLEPIRMPGQPYSLPQNNNPLNRAAHKWLREARASAPPNDLHLLSLAWWGLENGVEGEWPEGDRAALEQQVASLFGWAPNNDGSCRTRTARSDQSSTTTS